MFIDGVAVALADWHWHGHGVHCTVLPVALHRQVSTVADRDRGRARPCAADAEVLAAWRLPCVVASRVGGRTAEMQWAGFGRI